MRGAESGEREGVRGRRSFPLPAPLSRLLGADGAGFLVVGVASLLTIVGLWAVAREAPSAEAMPTPRPSPTAERPRDRFGIGAYPTARTGARRTPTTSAPGSGLPQRGSQSAPGVLHDVARAVSAGDATGVIVALGEIEAPAVPAPAPTPLPGPPRPPQQAR